MLTTSCVVTRAQFLARCPLSDSRPQPILEQPEMKPATCPETSPTLMPAQGLAPPPGLPAPPGLPDPKDSCPPVARDSQHQVLIRGVPNDILREQMMRTMIQQANLPVSVVSFSVRPGKEVGEVILTLSDFAAAKQCVDHFDGCEWGLSETAVVAHFVRVQEFAPESTIVKTPTPNALSVEALTFVPASTLSADAAVFMPLSADEKDKRSRFLSDATTEAGLSSDMASDCCESETEDWLKEPLLVAGVA